MDVIPPAEVPPSDVPPSEVPTAELLALLCDRDSWVGLDDPVGHPQGEAGYPGQLRRAAERSGRDESVITGEANIGGERVVVIAGDFAFLAGSVGRAAAGRVVAAVEHATGRGLPLVGLPVSGGTRMQEGTPAFLQMVPIAAALEQHRAAGLPYLVYLRHPTTGGVMATWGSLGDIVWAQPGALLGFLGPRVYEALYGEPFPPGVQVAENLQLHGIVDEVIHPSRLRARLSAVLRILRRSRGRIGVPDPGAGPSNDSPHGAAQEPRMVPPAPPAHPDPGAWGSVARTRDPARPGAAELIAHAVDDWIPLSGTGRGEPAPGLLLGVGTIGGVAVAVAAQDRAAQRGGAGRRGQLVGPGSLRAVHRVASLAERWGLVLLTVVDTPGAELSTSAEEGGLAGEIARCLARLMRVRTPSLSILLGEGAGGGALAMLPADRVIATSSAWVTPLPPEGASVITHRTADRAADMAAAQWITAAALAEVGAVDDVVPEDDDLVPAVTEALRAAVRELAPAGPAEELLARRFARWRSLGSPAAGW